jgi:predicted NAD/FAD-binding protein
VTLNPCEPIDPDKVIKRMTYHHPVFSAEGIAAQRRRDEIDGQRNTHYCGAYWSYGFHEDGVRSALHVGRHFGVDSIEGAALAGAAAPVLEPVA